jgi:hypothetical protein
MKKRILLISSDFFNYYKLITTELENQGWDVVYLNDRPSAHALVKIAIRKFRFLMSWYLDYYYSKKIENLGAFDHVLIVKGEGVTPKIVEKIKKNHSKGKIFLYLWDGIKNSTGALKIATAVDRVFTFDPQDALEFKFELLPLFYVNSVNNSISTQTPGYKWHMSFIGSIHSDRLKVISRVKKSLSVKDSFFVFVYFPSKLLFYFRFLFDSYFSDFQPQELSLTSLAKDKAQDIFNSSHAVLDIHHLGQTGLTMRTLEVLSLGKKLITTNETIKTYSFYDDRCICIIDRKNPQIDWAFFQKEVPNDYKNLLEPYELARWVRTLTTS